ncbi:hypothetical protein A2Z22_05180 [Candidatus Woesebacteria bacterium RBG_16_34_12]|uniref:Response regulatory domain-containing protein n=1 Tax=Candidatus Woesebacteria bacterium RBG_16_34_12 TaxID=1802480 RepID=A0A1F7XB08_9BACT|nr:MAG: hypothetical protein A2Z22_05180 [Candidatus Woesebacteria bacterium RBG_16_34_12]
MAKILLIEDDPLVVRMYQKVLAFEGFQIDCAPDGNEGIRKAKEIKPDLIFCDVMMPKMNGIEVLENLKADPETANIPVIMLTNLSGTHDAETALEKGAFAYMVKSEYKPHEVAEKARQFIQGFTNSTAKAQPAVVQNPPAQDQTVVQSQAPQSQQSQPQAQTQTSTPTTASATKQSQD